ERPRTAGFQTEISSRTSQQESGKLLKSGQTGVTAMKLFTGSVAAAALAFSAASAEAQLVTSARAGSPSFVRVSDIDGPYAAMPEVPPPPRFGRVPSLLPPVEVYTVLRENGYLPRSEEHTSELQSRENLVCRLLLEKKK